MPGNTKQLKKDVDQKPAPQYFDPVLDEYGYLYGSNGATRHIIYGANGEPISTTGNKLAVRATEMETTLGTLLTKTGFDAKVDLALSALRDALRGTGNKSLTDLATAQAALAAVIGEAAAAPTANTILARLKSLEDKIDAITTGTTPAVTQLTGSIMELYGASLDDRPDATTVPIGTTFTIVDDTGNFDSYISDGTNWMEV